MRIMHQLRLAEFWKRQNKPLELLHILESLLANPELSPFIYLRYHVFRTMAFAYFSRGELSRGLRMLQMALNLVPDEDHQIRADLELIAVHMCLVQSRLKEARPKIDRALLWLQSFHYQGTGMSWLHLISGQHALACGDMDGTEVEFNIALDLLTSYSAFHDIHLARVWLARLELCRQRPNSCLALIQSAEIPHLPSDV